MVQTKRYDTAEPILPSGSTMLAPPLMTLTLKDCECGLRTLLGLRPCSETDPSPPLPKTYRLYLVMPLLVVVPTLFDFRKRTPSTLPASPFRLLIKPSR